MNIYDDADTRDGLWQTDDDECEYQKIFDVFHEVASCNLMRLMKEGSAMMMIMKIKTIIVMEGKNQTQ